MDMIGTTPIPLPELAGRFAWAFKWLLEMIGYDAWRRQIGGPLLGAMTQRLWRLWARLRTAFTRWQAGTLRPPRPRPSRAGAPAAVAPPDRLAGLPPGDWRLLKRLLPRDFGWLKRVMPNLMPYAHAFIDLVADAETQALVAAAPQVGRILRPLCHMLGLPLPEWLKLPKRVRVRKKDTSPRLIPRRRLTPREQAEAAMQRSLETGEPIDPAKLSSVAYGYVLHTPRDARCPPPEIGYARSRWPKAVRDADSKNPK
jgi:hypothetical protein